MRLGPYSKSIMAKGNRNAVVFYCFQRRNQRKPALTSIIKIIMSSFDQNYFTIKTFAVSTNVFSFMCLGKISEMIDGVPPLINLFIPIFN